MIKILIVFIFIWRCCRCRRCRTDGWFDRSRQRATQFTRSLHTHVKVIVFFRKLVTIQCRRPGETKVTKNRITSILDRLTQRSARTNVLWNLLCTERHVDGTEEEAQLRRAVVLYEWEKSVDLDFSIHLTVLCSKIRHSCHVVSQSLTCFNSNRFTGSRIIDSHSLHRFDDHHIVTQKEEKREDGG